MHRARAKMCDAQYSQWGAESAGGLCLWHVVGSQSSLKEWALEQGWNGRRLSQEVASGILVAALGALAAHIQSSNAIMTSLRRRSNAATEATGSEHFTNRPVL